MSRPGSPASLLEQATRQLPSTVRPLLPAEAERQLFALRAGFRASIANKPYDFSLGTSTAKQMRDLLSDAAHIDSSVWVEGVSAMWELALAPGASTSQRTSLLNSVTDVLKTRSGSKAATTLLRIDWRRLYTVLQRVVYWSGSRLGAWACTSRTSLLSAVRASRPYFPAAEARNVAALLTPTIVSTSTSESVQLLSLLLPASTRTVDLPPGTVELWMRSWALSNLDPAVDAAWGIILRSIVANDVRHAEAVAMVDAGRAAEPGADTAERPLPPPGDDACNPESGLQAGVHLPPVAAWLRFVPFLTSRLQQSLQLKVRGLRPTARSPSKLSRTLAGDSQAAQSAILTIPGVLVDLASQWRRYAGWLARLRPDRPSTARAVDQGDPPVATPSSVAGWPPLNLVLASASESQDVAAALSQPAASAAGTATTGGDQAAEEEAAPPAWVQPFDPIWNLHRLFLSFSTLAHPSNTGDHTGAIMVLCICLVGFVGQRTGHCAAIAAQLAPTDSDLCLHAADQDRAISMMMPMLRRLLYSPARWVSRFAADCLARMAGLCPQRVYNEAVRPVVLEGLDPGALTATHQAPAALTLLATTARSLLYPRPHLAADLPRILELSIPGLDPNDAVKTGVTALWLRVLAGSVAFVDATSEEDRRAAAPGAADDCGLAPDVPAGSTELPEDWASWFPKDHPDYSVVTGEADEAAWPGPSAGFGTTPTLPSLPRKRPPHLGGRAEQQELRELYRRAWEATPRLCDLAVEVTQRVLYVVEHAEAPTRDAHGVPLKVQSVTAKARQVTAALAREFGHEDPGALLLTTRELLAPWFAAMGPATFKRALKAVADWFAAHRAGGVDLTSAAAGVMQAACERDPALALPALVEPLLKQAGQVELSPKTRTWTLHLLSKAVRSAGAALISLVPRLAEAARLGLRFGKTEDGRRAAAAVIRSTLRALLETYTVEHRPLPPSLWQQGRLWTRWAWPMPLKEAAVQWHTPTAAERAAACQLTRAALGGIIGDLLARTGERLGIPGFVALAEPEAGAAEAPEVLQAAGWQSAALDMVGDGGRGSTEWVRRRAMVLQAVIKGLMPVLADRPGSEGDTRFSVATGRVGLTVHELLGDRLGRVLTAAMLAGTGVGVGASATAASPEAPAAVPLAREASSAAPAELAPWDDLAEVLGPVAVDPGLADRDKGGGKREGNAEEDGEAEEEVAGGLHATRSGCQPPATLAALLRRWMRHSDTGSTDLEDLAGSEPLVSGSALAPLLPGSGHDLSASGVSARQALLTAAHLIFMLARSDAVLWRSERLMVALSAVAFRLVVQRGRRNVKNDRAMAVNTILSRVSHAGGDMITSFLEAPVKVHGALVALREGWLGVLTEDRRVGAGGQQAAAATEWRWWAPFSVEPLMNKGDWAAWQQTAIVPAVYAGESSPVVAAYRLAGTDRFLGRGESAAAARAALGKSSLGASTAAAEAESGACPEGATFVAPWELVPSGRCVDDHSRFHARLNFSGVKDRTELVVSADAAFHGRVGHSAFAVPRGFRAKGLSRFRARLALLQRAAGGQASATGPEADSLLQELAARRGELAGAALLSGDGAQDSEGEGDSATDAASELDPNELLEAANAGVGPVGQVAKLVPPALQAATAQALGGEAAAQVLQACSMAVIRAVGRRTAANTALLQLVASARTAAGDLGRMGAAEDEEEGAGPAGLAGLARHRGRALLPLEIGYVQLLGWSLLRARIGHPTISNRAIGDVVPVLSILPGLRRTLAWSAIKDLRFMSRRAGRWFDAARASRADEGASTAGAGVEPETAQEREERSRLFFALRAASSILQHACSSTINASPELRGEAMRTLVSGSVALAAACPPDKEARAVSMLAVTTASFTRGAVEVAVLGSKHSRRRRLLQRLTEYRLLELLRPGLHGEVDRMRRDATPAAGLVDKLVAAAAGDDDEEPEAGPGLVSPLLSSLPPPPPPPSSSLSMERAAAIAPLGGEANLTNEDQRFLRLLGLGRSSADVTAPLTATRQTLEPTKGRPTTGNAAGGRSPSVVPVPSLSPLHWRLQTTVAGQLMALTRTAAPAAVLATSGLVAAEDRRPAPLGVSDWARTQLEAADGTQPVDGPDAGWLQSPSSWDALPPALLIPTEPLVLWLLSACTSTHVPLRKLAIRASSRVLYQCLVVHCPVRSLRMGSGAVSAEAGQAPGPIAFRLAGTVGDSIGSFTQPWPLVQRLLKNPMFWSQLTSSLTADHVAVYAPKGSGGAHNRQGRIQWSEGVPEAVAAARAVRCGGDVAGVSGAHTGLVECAVDFGGRAAFAAALASLFAVALHAAHKLGLLTGSAVPSARRSLEQLKRAGVVLAAPDAQAVEAILAPSAASSAGEAAAAPTEEMKAAQASAMELCCGLLRSVLDGAMEDHEADGPKLPTIEQLAAIWLPPAAPDSDLADMSDAGNLAEAFSAGAPDRWLYRGGSSAGAAEEEQEQAWSAEPAASTPLQRFLAKVPSWRRRSWAAVALVLSAASPLLHRISSERARGWSSVVLDSLASFWADLPLALTTSRGAPLVQMVIARAHTGLQQALEQPIDSRRASVDAGTEVPAVASGGGRGRMSVAATAAWLRLVARLVAHLGNPRLCSHVPGSAVDLFRVVVERSPSAERVVAELGGGARLVDPLGCLLGWQVGITRPLVPLLLSACSHGLSDVRDKASYTLISLLHAARRPVVHQCAATNPMPPLRCPPAVVGSYDDTLDVPTDALGEVELSWLEPGQGSPALAAPLSRLQRLVTALAPRGQPLLPRPGWVGDIFAQLASSVYQATAALEAGDGKEAGAASSAAGGAAESGAENEAARRLVRVTQSVAQLVRSGSVASRSTSMIMCLSMLAPLLSAGYRLSDEEAGRIISFARNDIAKHVRLDRMTLADLEFDAQADVLEAVRCVVPAELAERPVQAPAATTAAAAGKKLGRLGRARAREQQLLQTLEPLPSLHSLLNIVLRGVAAESWHERAEALDIAVTSHIFHLLTLPPEARQIVESLSQRVLEDVQVEARSRAAGAMTALATSLPVPDRARLLGDFLKLAHQRLPDKPRPTKIGQADERTPAEKEAAAAAKKKHQRAVRRRHAAVLGAGAIVHSHPFSVPSYLPAPLSRLARFHTSPAPVKQAVQRVFAEFKRTHQDSWDEDRQKFTPDQLADLTELLVSPSYYA